MDNSNKKYYVVKDINFALFLISFAILKASWSFSVFSKLYTFSPSKNLLSKTI